MERSHSDLMEMEAVLARAIALVEAAHGQLEQHLARMTRKERKKTAIVPPRFADAGRAAVQAARDLPELAESTGFDPEQVLALLKRASRLRYLARQAEAIARLSEDSQQRTLGEAYASTLQLYRAGQAGLDQDPSLEAVVQPLKGVLEAPRRVAWKRGGRYKGR